MLYKNFNKKFDNLHKFLPTLKDRASFVSFSEDN
jgi:hypothetical protein